MNWLHVLRMRLRVLLKRDVLERELDEELRFHLEMQTEENLRRGMSPEEARRQAILLFGGVEGHREACRDARGVRVLEQLGSDLRYASRSLRRSPAFAIAAVLTLALGIGANSALFGLLNALFFRMPAGIPETDRLVWLDVGRMIEEASYADYRDIAAAAAPAFEGIAAYTPGSLALGTGSEPARVSGQLVSANYFGVLGTGFVQGRGFLPGEGRSPGASPVVVLGHRLWRERFAGDPEVIGKQVVLNGHSFAAVGVAAPGFVGTSIEEPAELWVPATMQPVALPRGKVDVLGNRRLSVFRLVGRLREGVTPEEASAVLAVVAKRLDALEPERHSPYRIELVPLRGWIQVARAKQMFPVIGFAWIITGLVLVIACANVANLLLARAVARRREIGIRVALGAGRGRLVRFLLAEALLLATVGGAVGLLASYWAATWFRLRISGPWGPLDVSPDARALGFTLALATLTGILFGLVPAWRASRPEVAPTLKGDSPAWLRRTRMQGGLVVVQLALSLVLLASAAVFMGKLQATQRIDVGFDTENVLALSFDLEALGYPQEARTAFHSHLRDRLERLPGVQSVSVPSYVPMTRGAMLESASLPGEAGPAGQESTCAPSVAVVGIGPDYFRTLGVGLPRGRGIEERDLSSGARTVVVSESLARACWPGQDPIGRQVGLGGGRDAGPAEVIGVARDIVVGSTDDLGRPHAYIPASQAPSLFSTSDTHLLVRTSADPAALVPLLRAEFRRLNPHLPVFGVRTLAEVVEEQIGLQRRLTGVVAGFGTLALVLAALGLYGVIAFTVVGRTREIGLRIALGAPPGQVVRVFMRDGARLIAVGLVVGGALSLAVGRLIGGITEGVRPGDPLALAGVGAVLAGVALLACWLPARRAARIDPTVALRAE